MSTFNVPKRDEVSPANQTVFDNLEKALGFVPNLYATYAYSDNALVNCEYCLAAHTAIGKMNGYTEDQILELRAGKSTFDTKLDALAKLAKNITENRGNADQDVLDYFFDAGWTKENLIDTIVLVGDKTISNYINNTTGIPVDFPEVQPLDEVNA
jgi:hypothetical protein